MQLTREEMTTAKSHLVDRGNYAPHAVIGAMLSLMDADDVVASIAEKGRGDSGTTWRALWLSETSIAYVHAHKATPDWDLDSHHTDRESDSIEGWRRSLSSLQALGVTNARMTLEHNEWVADIVHELTFAEGASVAVPLFGQLPSARRADDYDAFMREVHKRLA